MITRTIEWADSWKRRGQEFAASTVKQDVYMRSKGPSGSKYKVDYVQGKTKPTSKGNWLWFGRFMFDGVYSNLSHSVVLKSGRQIPICNTSFKKLFGSVRVGWLRLRKMA